MAIRVIVTGGTISKEYNPKTQLLELKRSRIKEMIGEGRSLAEVKMDELMLKDSLEMTQKDREKILDRCKKSREDRIIVIHGTDTMEDTAKVLGKDIKDKTIVLTGAIEPEVLEEDDSLFNLGGALIAVQLLPKGVYVVMNGKIFDWDNVKKDKDKCIFKELRN